MFVLYVCLRNVGLLKYHFFINCLLVLVQVLLCVHVFVCPCVGNMQRWAVLVFFIFHQLKMILCTYYHVKLTGSGNFK